MRLKNLSSIAALGLVAGLYAMPSLGLAQEIPAPTVDKGDVAWMSISSVLVLLMTVPGLALFYGGLVRTKNMLAVMTQVFAISAVMAVIWVLYGYSMAFTDGGSMNSYVGGFSKIFLKGVDLTTLAATFSNGVYLPEYSFVIFQMTFAMITPGLIVGALAERVKFSSLMVFSILWATFIYFPMAHMVWWWGGPDTLAAGAIALAAAGTDQVAIDAANAMIGANGMLFNWGALDFAGGTVVHINAGIAALVGAIVLGPRIGFRKESMAPHSLTMTMIGAALLWVGWFGFNAGSNLESNSVTALAIINTFVATAGAAVGWLFIEWIMKGKPSMLGLVSGAVAGLVAVTPASGFAGPVASMFLGMFAGVVCFIFVAYIKNMFKIDDALDVFGIHCVGGVIGALATGILVNPALGGAGIPDYLSVPGTLQVAPYVFATAFMAQAKAVVFTLLFSGIGSYILFKLIDMTMGLRVKEDVEREGLDLAEHGERAYNM
ncbi:MAG: ammonium transporter [Paracoccaceae bacterium]